MEFQTIHPCIQTFNCRINQSLSSVALHTWNAASTYFFPSSCCNRASNRNESAATLPFRATRRCFSSSLVSTTGDIRFHYNKITFHEYSYDTRTVESTVACSFQINLFPSPNIKNLVDFRGLLINEGRMGMICSTHEVYEKYIHVHNFIWKN